MADPKTDLNNAAGATPNPNKPKLGPNGEPLGPDGQPLAANKPAPPPSFTPGSQGPGPAAGPNDDKDKDRAVQIYENLLAALIQGHWLKNENDVNSFSRNFLKSMDWSGNPLGSNLTIYNHGDKTPLLDLSPSGAVSIVKNGDINDKTFCESDTHIDALLKGSALAKMANGAGTDQKPAVYIHSVGDESRMMMAYAAQLAGMKAAGEDGKPVDISKLDPAVKKKMDDAWAKMDPSEEFRNQKDAQVTAPATPAANSNITPGKVMPVDDSNVGAVGTHGKPTVLMVYDPEDKTAQQKLDQVAAMAGDKLEVVKMNIHDVDAIKQSLPENDALREQLDKGETGLTVLDGKGNTAASRQSIPASADDIKKWVELPDVLNTAVFPPPAATPTGTAPAPAAK